MATLSRNPRPVKVSTHDLYDAMLDGMDQDFDPKNTTSDWRPVLGYAVHDGEFVPECSLDFPDDFDHPTDADRADDRQQWTAEFEEELDDFLNGMSLERDLAGLSDLDDDIDPEGSVAHYEPFEPGDGDLDDYDVLRHTGSCG